MSREVNAEIIAIGTEILLGEITDTNSVYIARLLRDLGINLYYMTSVGDNEARIAEAIRIALSRGQVAGGGLSLNFDRAEQVEAVNRSWSSNRSDRGDITQAHQVAIARTNLDLLQVFGFAAVICIRLHKHSIAALSKGKIIHIAAAHVGTDGGQRFTNIHVLGIQLFSIQFHL
ncbi:hypothetical protein JVX88_33940 [Leptolyngbya sp. 7M]|nr:hypothetical protein JVX88_33940 [Leptolyngbya sp. 7M]